MKEAIFGVIRHAVTTAGGAIVANGLVTSAQLETLAGALVIVAGVIWSIVEKKLRN